MTIDPGGETTTQLLTLLNVSATRAGKRKWSGEHTKPSQKLNKRRTVRIEETPVSISEAEPSTSNATETKKLGEEKAQNNMDADADDDIALGEDGVDEDGLENNIDPYEIHFGPHSHMLSDSKRSAVDQREWNVFRGALGKLSNVAEYSPEERDETKRLPRISVLDRLRTPLQERQAKMPQELSALQNDLLAILGSYKDLYITRTALETQQCAREAVMLHALNHVTKKRRRVLKNNERLSSAARSGAEPPEDVQDQGFTRPSILVLLPFRSFALKWLSALIAHTPSPSYQIENRSRFESEYGLPPGTIDKLANAEPGTYPKDHVEMFKGNVDDSFRVGIKMTRKSVKLFADFYGCDIIFASPLGLRLSIQKEKNADFLSSIEMLIFDQLDALTMQNWEHVQYILSQMNQIPKESHDVDFSRIKPWYLDGQAAYLRQSILLTAYETPETRALFNQDLKNVSGKIRTERRWNPVVVPEGVQPDFEQFDSVSPKDEPEKRFKYFTTQVLPTIVKSAVQSVQTVIFIPSSFDFIRVRNYFRKNVDVPFAVLSEYSSNQDISRARQAFFTGKKSFLLISERFHFFRRYKIRGIRNLVFYGPPDHPQFYTEFLSYPFLDDGVEPSDITCKVLYSRYDVMRMERIVGSEYVGKLVHRSV